MQKRQAHQLMYAPQHIPGRVFASARGPACGFVLLEVSTRFSVTRALLIFGDRMSAWVDLGLMSLTFVCAIVWNIEVGILVSVIVSLLLVVHRSSKTRMTILVRLASFRPTGHAPTLC
jgi:hypothetical protein